MFRGQFKLTKREERCAGDLSTFVVLEYLKAWFTATDTEAAPRTDLTLLERLCGYQNPPIPVPPGRCGGAPQTLSFVFEGALDMWLMITERQ